MTKFSERKDDPSKNEVWQQILNEVHGVCDCGHADFAHKSIERELRINPDIYEYGECKKCMCPRFTLQHTATYRTILNEKPLNGDVKHD